MKPPAYSRLEPSLDGSEKTLPIQITREDVEFILRKTGRVTLQQIVVAGLSGCHILAVYRLVRLDHLIQYQLRDVLDLSFFGINR